MQQHVDAYRSDPEFKQKADEAMQQLLARSATDLEFRQLLLSDSRAALSRHFGSEVPETMNVAFIENDADATFVLPEIVDTDAELSEVELEAVAGGTASVAVAVVLVAAYLYYQEVSQD